MLIYELLEDLKFKMDYKHISNVLNKSNKIVLKTKSTDNTQIDYNKFGIYKNLVKEFVNIFSSEFSEEETYNMLKNLSTLEIKTEIPSFKLNFHYFISTGYYNSKENIIVIETNNKNQIEHTLFHELLHMASRVNKDKEKYCGFNLYNMLGIALNEDYTEYLLEEKFYKIDDYNPKYSIIKEFEYLIGKEKLQELYFKADLSSLIKELSKYNSKKDIIKLLYEYDGIYNFQYNYGKVHKIENKVEKLIIKKEKQKVKEYVI